MIDQQTPTAMAERRDGDGNEDGTGLGIATRTRAKTKQPTPYRVLLLNDDYTPMEFVVLVLQRFFPLTYLIQGIPITRDSCLVAVCIA